jgi:alpha-L-fucosidase
MRSLILLAFVIVPAGLAAAAETKPQGDYSYAEGPYQADWKSLGQYQCPEWFRDAKFGIWAHWGPQCQPEFGDWYARSMYIEGSPQYKYHLEHYGHPSAFGFKDVCNAWKADKFDPEKLIDLYRRAGAKYFVAMANHHCNFDNFDSKYQPWNSVHVGPKKDLVGLWEKAARKAGLRFGVTVHAARSWEWYEVSQLSDKSGPKAGVPYDGRLTKADGRGQWWDGLDPQDLYAQNHKPNSDPVNRNSRSRTPGDPPSTAYCQKFYHRVIDLLDKYQPDLLYFDDSVLPLRNIDEQIGLGIAAHLYNSSCRRSGGRSEAVMNTKGLDEQQRKCLVWDIERGVSTRVEPFVWQTDTCIGGWHYNRPIFEHHGYKTATQVIHMLLDIVSKNGNLLLNIPVRGDGTIDEDEQQVLEDLAAWMAVNQACIFGTRPWKIFGEGPSAVERPQVGRFGGASDTRKKPYTPADFRFTTKAGALYAAALAWPADGKLTLRTLAAGAPGIRGDVTGVELLGAQGKVGFQREPAGLVVTLPAEKPCGHAFVLKITGLDLAASEPVVPAIANAECVTAEADGSFVLEAGSADLHGKRLRAGRHGGSGVSIGAWDDFAEYVSWPILVEKPGKYRVTVRVSSQRSENEFAVEASPQKLAGKAPKTGAWETFVNVKLGTLELARPGKMVVSVRPAGDAKKWKAMNLALVTLKPVK